MNAALCELVVWNLRGRVVRRARLLRQPKHLVAFLAGLAYFAFFALRPLLRGRARVFNLDWLGDPLYLSAAQLGLGVGLAVFLTLTWLFASSQPALSLGETEAHLLLPAPLSRREVLQYALLKQQPGILLGALVMTAFSGTGSPLGRLARFFLLWALLTLIDLHLKGVNLWKAAWRERPRRRAVLVQGLAVAAGLAWWTAVAVALAAAVRAAGGGGAARDVLTRALAAARSGPLDELLAPFLWLAAPLFGSTVTSRLLGVLFIAALLVANHEWVLRSRVRFEEAALARSQRELSRRDRRQRFAALPQRSRRLAPFALAAGGRPETAIYWKSLLLRSRTPRLRLVARGAAVLLGLGALLTVGLKLAVAPAVVAQTFAAGIGTSFLLLAPPMAGVVFRNDLRADLLAIEVLRAWPVAGARLVAAEVLASATSALLVALAGAGMVAVAAASLALGRGAELDFLPAWLTAGAPGGIGLAVSLASLLLAGAAVALASSAVQNVAALAFPGWVRLGVERHRGTANLGQGVLTGVAHLLALAVGAIPAAVAVLAVVGILQGLGGLPFTAWEMPLIGLAVAAVFATEAWLLVRLGGRLWDRLDPSHELLDAPDEAAGGA